VIDPKTSTFAPVHLSLSLPADVSLTAESQVAVVAHIRGLEQEFRAALSGLSLPDGLQTGPAPLQPSLEDALAQHDFLQVSPQDEHLLLVSPGTWDVQGDLVLPRGTDLVVPAGTVLRFSENSILYLDGALKLLGEPAAPVLITAQGSGWGGMLVLNAARDSLWRYAAVEKTTGISREGWILTGGITFYRSNITLEHVLLGNNQTEDAINVIHSQFRFVDSQWKHTFADAFDSDFSQGEVTNCLFEDIAGDAVDVSGSTVTVSGGRMERITDKGISAGENSSVSVQDVRIDNVGIGIASKDLSKVTVSGGEISNARFSALAAYIKKPVYGPGSIDAQRLTVSGTEKVGVAQTGSSILVDGQAVEPVEMDVDLLYSQGVLGN
jgi:hypothetical protein